MRTSVSLALVVPVLALALLTGGCDSEAVAPDDDLPPLSQEDLASQAGILAAVLADVAPEIVRGGFDALAKDTYTLTFTGDVAGSIEFDFRCGGAEGTPCAYDAADWGRMWTSDEGTIVVAIAPGGQIAIAFDVTGDIDQSTDTAVLAGGGSFVAGEYVTIWTLEGFAVGTTGYPTGGTLTVASGGQEVAVVFDGTRQALVTAGGTTIGTVDLETGDFTPAP